MATAATTAKAPAAAAKGTATTPVRRDGAPGAMRSYRFDSAHNAGVDGESSHMADPVDARAFYADPVLKAVERGIVIAEVVLQEKSGGRSGHYRRGEPS